MDYKCNRFYIAFGERHRNIWRAYDTLVGTSHNVEPYLENDTFKNLQGIKIDLERDYETEFLKSLFDRFKHLTLLYSGGVDSNTIAVKAKQNNLQFNKTYTLKQNLNPLQDAMDKNHVSEYITNFFRDDPGYEVINNSVEWLESVFENKEWWYSGHELDTAPIAHFLHSPIYNEETVYITGHDKPMLLFHNNEWYTTAMHGMMNDVWEIPNVLLFYGYNEFYPEIVLSHAMKLKNYYVENFGTPTETKWINYKMHMGTPVSDDFIRGVNSSLGRIAVPDTRHDVDQAHIHPAISKRGIERQYDLIKSGRETLAMQIYKDCANLYHKHPQINWEFPPFELKGLTTWFINLNTFEYISGDQLQAIIGN